MDRISLCKLTAALLLTTVAKAQVFCAQDMLSTRSYDCALIASSGSCPVNTAARYSYWAVTATGATATATGCCTATATPHFVEDGVACCPCEAFCTGYLPNMCGWSTNDGMSSHLYSTRATTPGKRY